MNSRKKILSVLMALAILFSLSVPALAAGDGIILIAVYPGHEEGDAEGKMICEYLATLKRFQYCATRINILNSPTSPYFIIIENKA